MPNITIPLNPRVRVAREEKKINIVKLTEENNAINNNKINNENKINNNINLNINKNIENNNDYNENENGIPIVEEKKENILTNINSVNFTKPNMRDEIQDEIEINKVNDVNEPLEVSPMDDYNFSSKTPNRKFHRVKILKKNPSNQLLKRLCMKRDTILGFGIRPRRRSICNMLKMGLTMGITLILKMAWMILRFARNFSRVVCSSRPIRSRAILFFLNGNTASTREAWET